MAIVRWNPYRELREMQRQFNSFFNDFRVGPSREGEVEEGNVLDWMPAAEINEDKDAYSITLELPGIPKEAVKINLNQDILTITGEKQDERNIKEDTCHVSERFYGKFSRSFRLPGQVNAEKIQAKFEHGVLQLELPKVESVKPKQITIQ
jgi:HSP20 family protein